MNTALEKLEELVMIGDEEGARSYLTEHIKEFPLEVRKKFVFALFMEAVENQTAVNNAQIQAIDEGVKELKEIEKDLANLNDKKAILDVKKKIYKK